MANDDKHKAQITLTKPNRERMDTYRKQLLADEGSLGSVTRVINQALVEFFQRHLTPHEPEKRKPKAPQLQRTA